MYAYQLLHLKREDGPKTSALVDAWLKYESAGKQTVDVRLSSEDLLHAYEWEGSIKTDTLTDRDILDSIEKWPNRKAAGALLWKLNRIVDTNYALDAEVRDLITNLSGIVFEPTPFVLLNGDAVNRIDSGVYNSSHKAVECIKIRVDAEQVFVAFDLSSDAARTLLLRRLRRQLWQT